MCICHIEHLPSRKITPVVSTAAAVRARRMRQIAASMNLLLDRPTIRVEPIDTHDSQ
jgi:hypothetical protein